MWPLSNMPPLLLPSECRGAHLPLSVNMEFYTKSLENSKCSILHPSSYVNFIAQCLTHYGIMGLRHFGFFYYLFACLFYCKVSIGHSRNATTYITFKGGI